MIEAFGHWTHIGTVAFTVAANSIAVGLGEGLTSFAALQAIDKQPAAQNDIARISVLGTALIETAAVLGVTMSFFLLLSNNITNSTAHIAELGIACAIGFSGFAIGIASSFPAQEACFAVARQPFFADKILRFMLITQSIIQTPIIFGFIIGMLIKLHSNFVTTLEQSIMLSAAGLAIGLGSIGPATGLALFAKSACRGIGLNRRAYGQLMSFTFISQAIIETPIIFALTVALVCIFYNTQATPITSVAWIAAASCMSLGTLGPGIASGKTAAAAAHEIALDHKQYSVLSKTSMFAQGLIDACAIYTFLISFLIILLT